MRVVQHLRDTSARLVYSLTAALWPLACHRANAHMPSSRAMCHPTPTTQICLYCAGRPAKSPVRVEFICFCGAQTKAAVSDAYGKGRRGSRGGSKVVWCGKHRGMVSVFKMRLLELSWQCPSCSAKHCTAATGDPRPPNDRSQRIHQTVVCSSCETSWGVHRVTWL